MEIGIVSIGGVAREIVECTGDNCRQRSPIGSVALR